MAEAYVVPLYCTVTLKGSVLVLFLPVPWYIILEKRLQCTVPYSLYVTCICCTVLMCFDYILNGRHVSTVQSYVVMYYINQF